MCWIGTITHTLATLCVAQYLPVPPRDHTMARADQGLVVLLCLHAADLLAELSTKFRESFYNIRRIILLNRACLIWNVKAITSRLFQQWEDSPNIGGKFAKFGWQLYLLALLINSTCSQTLGMESGTIQNYQITAASSQSSQVAPDKVSCCRIK